MSLFDQRYYALTKAHMSRIGIWPEQSKYVRIILPLTMFAITLTLVGPGLIRLHDAWRDISIFARSTTILLMWVANFYFVFSCIHYADNMKLSLKYIENHWVMLKNTPAVIVLDKYAERGGSITVGYSICLYAVMTLYMCVCLSPMILDFVDPVNETRSKVYVIEAEYGVDENKYYWFIFAHTYIVAAIVINISLAIGAMYILWTVHACALFESVGFNLELIAYENAITLRSDWNYKKIRDCIILHTEAISFTDLVEDSCSTPSGVTLGFALIISVISSVQALINWKHPEVLIQQVTFIIVIVLHLYIGSVPGQELINRSGKIHTTAYNLDWQDMPVNAQKLLIPILLRSSRPCYLTAGKVYVMSMETFSSAIRTVLSYFVIFAQMI